LFGNCPTQLCRALLNAILKTMENSNCKHNDLMVNIKATRTPRFKAGADLSKTANVLNVEFHEELTAEREVTEVKLHLSSEACAKSTPLCE